MRATRSLVTVTSATALVLAVSTGAAYAQQGSQGPLVMQPIENPVVFAPDVKITDIGHQTGVFLGGYAGVNLDQKFLIGGAGYWLVDGYNGLSMGYGGLLLGWRVMRSGSVSLAVRDLVGGGSASTYYGAYPVYGPPPPYPDPRHGYYYPNSYYGYWNGFFVTEPEVRAQFALGPAVSVDAGVGYRVVAGANGLSDQLHGVAGSIAVRFNFGQ